MGLRLDAKAGVGDGQAEGSREAIPGAGNRVW